MADEITSKILIQIRDGVRSVKTEVGALKDEVTELKGELKAEVGELRRDFTILARLTRGIDTRLGHVEEDLQEVRTASREQVFLGRRVSVLEDEVRDFRSTTERRLDALEAERTGD